jgi:hypothetical protein
LLDIVLKEICSFSPKFAFFYSLDVLATVLEEMPPFPEKESSGLLNLLKKKRPGRVPDNPGEPMNSLGIF